ncbi:MAG: Motility protein FimV, partial [Gammaproteobacteria bacterium]
KEEKAEPIPDLQWEPLEKEEKAEVPAPETSAEEEPLTEKETVDVRLELARAYLDMGDKEEARKLLEEAMEEGDERQKQEARELLNQAT